MACTLDFFRRVRYPYHVYIRKNLTRNRQTGVTYCDYRLVEAVRTPKGPRQRVVLHLGPLSLQKVQLKKLARILEAKLIGQPSLFETDTKLIRIADEAMQNLEFRRSEAQMQEAKPVPDFIQVDINSVGTRTNRSAGPEMIGHFAWETLGFDQLLRKMDFSSFEISLAEVVVLGRLIQPGSEQHTREWINHHSALLELLALDLIGKNAIYEIADRLLAKKAEIEKHLREREQALFPKPRLLFLYDLTNTYLEGQGKGNAFAKRGHCKQKRNDRPLVTMAMLVESQGFPIFSQIYRGNQGEPETLAMVLSRLEVDYQGVLPCQKPTIVMDRGIATAGNLTLLRKKEFPFVVVERRRTEKDYEQDFLEMVGFTTFQTGSGPIKLKKVNISDGARVLVQSEGRVAKEQAMDSLKEKRFREDVEGLAGSVEKGNVIVPEKVGRRIGRILQKYPSMARYYEVIAEADSTEKKIVKVHLKRKPEAKTEESIQGCYVIETSHQELGAKEIWDLYTTLHRVEKGFQYLKSDLGFRPVHHQLGSRTEAHLFISVLAYHLLVTTETLLNAAGDHRSWATIRMVMGSLTRDTVTFIDAEGFVHHIRVTGTQEPAHRKILEDLKIAPQFRRSHRRFKLRL